MIRIRRMAHRQVREKNDIDYIVEYIEALLGFSWNVSRLLVIKSSAIKEVALHPRYFINEERI